MEKSELIEMKEQLKDLSYRLEKAETTLAWAADTLAHQSWLMDQNFKLSGILVDISCLEHHKERIGVYEDAGNKELESSVCRLNDILHNKKWVDILKEDFTNTLRDLNVPVDDTWFMHRKLWEFVYIIQALYERGMLVNGKKGLGFAVGKEPLPSIFANCGCEIVPTDLDSKSPDAKCWNETNQHADSLNVLFKPSLCNEDTFYSNVDFRFLNMNDIDDDIKDFDFCWSSCALEHLGSIEKGKQFIYNMLKCLKPGGIAVHTTEYNLSSRRKTIESGTNVFFRESDFEEIYSNVTALGHHMEKLDFR